MERGNGLTGILGLSLVNKTLASRLPTLVCSEHLRWRRCEVPVHRCRRRLSRHLDRRRRTRLRWTRFRLGIHGRRDVERPRRPRGHRRRPGHPRRDVVQLDLRFGVHVRGAAPAHLDAAAVAAALPLMGVVRREMQLLPRGLGGQKIKYRASRLVVHLGCVDL